MSKVNGSVKSQVATSKHEQQSAYNAVIAKGLMDDDLINQEKVALEQDKKDMANAVSDIDTAYANIHNWSKYNNDLAHRLGATTEELVSHLIKSVDFFHSDSGGKRIEIINGAVTTATIGKHSRKVVSEWLQPIVGHHLDNKGFFGKRNKKVSYDEVIAGAIAYIQENPDWTIQAERPTPEYNLTTQMNGLIKALESKSKKAEANGYTKISLELTKIVKSLQFNLTFDEYRLTAEEIAESEENHNLLDEAIKEVS